VKFIIYKQSDIILLVGGVITFILSVLILLLTPKHAGSLTKTFATILLVSSLTAAFFAGILLFGVWSSSQTLILGSSIISPALIGMIQSTITGIIFSVQFPLYIVSAIVFIASITLFVIGSMIKDDKQQDPSEVNLRPGNVTNRPEVVGIQKKLETKEVAPEITPMIAEVKTEEKTDIKPAEQNSETM
jgi:hypothetical protein